MRKKIFITGISSEIIMAAVDRLDSNEYEIYGLTRNPENVSSNQKMTLIKGDIKDLEAIRKYLKNCSIIIHAAAVTHSHDAKKYFEVNLEATKEIIKLANQYEIKKFIFISSNTAGDNSGAYGQSKFMAEKYLEDNFRNWLILRPAEVYGTKNKEGIDKFISGVIDNPIAIYPAGVPSRFYPVHLNDVAEIIHEVVFNERLTKEKITICGPTGYSFPELIQIIKLYKNQPIPSIPVPRSLMFFIETVSKLAPFYTGIFPDQIPRLYSRKNSGTTIYRRGKEKFEVYLKERCLAKTGRSY